MKWFGDDSWWFWDYLFTAENAFGVEVKGCGGVWGRTEKEARDAAFAEAKSECDCRSLKINEITSIERRRSSAFIERLLEGARKVSRWTTKSSSTSA